jgi:hypothetical protein
MRPNTVELVKGFSRIFPVKEPVLEIGSYRVEGQEGLANLRDFYPGARYIGVDMREGPGVDQVEDFETRTSFADGSVGTILSSDTVEHVYDVFHFMRETERILAPGGVLLLISVMYFPIHSYPYDYWRFTPEAFKRLASPIGSPLVLSQGPEDFPDTVIAVVRKGGKLTGEEEAAFTRVVREMSPLVERCGWVHPDHRRKKRSPLQKLLGIG